MSPSTGTVDLEGRVDDICRRWPAVGLAVGLVQDGRRASFVGHGVADTQTLTPITPETGFRVASIPEVVPARDSLMPDFGESVLAGRTVPTLAGFYGDELRLVAEPGTLGALALAGAARLVRWS